MLESHCILIASVSMATVGEDGSPQVCTIGMMHVEDEKLHFYTALGKPICRVLGGIYCERDHQKHIEATQHPQI